MIKPYYQDEWTTIYLGDCRDILPDLEVKDALITDPVWPDADVKLLGCENPYQLFADMCEVIPSGVDRLVVQLGCDSDPRFLAGIPKRWPFLRVCWLDYARPSYKGRLLYTGDVAYAFGRPPAYIPHRQVMSGMCRSSRPDKDFISPAGLPHPCPRRLEHVKWLVHQFSDNQVLDPFMGSGTSAVAAKYLNRKFVGIEIEERFVEEAINRLRQSVMDFEYVK